MNHPLGLSTSGFIYTVYRVTDARHYRRMGQVESTFRLDGDSIAALARANIRDDNNDPAFVSGDLLEVYESFNEMPGSFRRVIP